MKELTPAARRLRHLARTVNFALLRGAASALGGLAVHVVWHWLGG